MHTPSLRFSGPVTALKIAGSRVLTVVAAAILFSTGVLTIALTTAESASAADKKPTGPQLSKKVLPPLKAAGDAFNAKQYDVAMTKLQEADAAEGKTPYDEFRIDELRALVYVTQNGKFAESLAIYEKHQSQSELIEPQLAEIRLKIMAQLAFRVPAHDKVLEYGKQWMATHPDDTGILDLMMRSSYIQKDYKSALASAKSAIAIAETAGKTPDELWLQLVPSCSGSLDDQAGALAGYEKLVRYYPKPEHWNKALEALLTTEKNDAANVYIFRLMAETGVLTRPEYYKEYAQRAMDKALPGEALKVLEAGFEKKHLGVAEKDKQSQQEQLKTARDKAKADRAQLPEIEKEAKAAKANNGQVEAGLGLAYYSFQMYEQAVQALEAGIAKGGLKNLEDYQMILAISTLRAGQKEKARSEFQKIPATSPYGRVAKFWVARTYDAPVVASAAAAPATAPTTAK